VTDKFADDATNAFAEGSGEKIPSLTFTQTDPETGVMTPKPIGTKLGGKVLEPPLRQQRRQFRTNKPLFMQKVGDRWESTTDPTDLKSEEVVVTVQTPEGERARLYVPVTGKKNADSMYQQIVSVIPTTGLAVGSDLFVELVGLTPNPQGGQPSKRVKASYTPPNGFSE
jgi:hypothetical protein